MNKRQVLKLRFFIAAFIVLSVACQTVINFAQNLVDVPEYTVEGDPSASPTPTAHLLETSEVTLEPETIDIAQYALNTIENELVPENDPAELAVRLGGVDFVPEYYPDPNAPYDVGAQQDFWITNTDTNDTVKVTAILRYETDHAYFWVGKNVTYRAADLENLAETFEDHIYPTDREFFGSEWTPGIDQDPHIYILYVPGVGFNTAGYFSSADSLPPQAHEYSNAHELFVFNSDNSPLSAPYTYGVLSHEFQHMIHWYRDRNETSWINEGFSELATLLNGYDPGGFDYYFMTNPDYQLNNWPNGIGSSTANYGASFLFMAYFLDRMGSETTQALVGHPENGLHSIDLVLEESNSTDPLTGELLTADDLVLDWALTNYIQDDSVLDGRFTYKLYDDPPRARPTETIYDCPTDILPRTVNQYGTDYIDISCSGNYNLNFQGALRSTLVPAFPYSGDFDFWSNKGDESDMTLTQQFDFTGVNGSLTLSYYTWYDIEEDYDYVYLLASTDGENWEILETPSGTDEDPSGNSYGWGYNGFSGGGYESEWILEQVDISKFAGQQVWLRFEYITDAAVHGEGLLLDDISIPEIGYFSDFETDEGGWVGEGFVRVPNYLPQTFRLALIYLGNDTRVEYLTLDAENKLDVSIQLGGEYDEVVLVVIGTTRYTRQIASYQIQLTQE